MPAVFLFQLIELAFDGLGLLFKLVGFRAGERLFRWLTPDCASAVPSVLYGHRAVRLLFGVDERECPQRLDGRVGVAGL